jgi:putative zinc finger/helix-turn-helix YgiT family protein
LPLSHKTLFEEDGMKCFQCGGRMEATEGTHRYDESGLKNVLLMNVPIYKCVSCGETEVEIPGMEELHFLLGLLILYKPTRLTRDEVRYLRKHMGRSQEELASDLGVTRITVTRWESGRTLRVDQDKHLRRLYIDRKSKEFDQFTAQHRILSVLLDKLPLPTTKQVLRLRREDWTRQSEQQSIPA